MMRTYSLLFAALALLFSAALGAQSVTVSVLTPSGGRLKSDVGELLGAAFPVGPLALPATIDLASSDIAASFLTTVVDQTHGDAVGILHTLRASVSGPKPPQTYTRSETQDGFAHAPQALVVTVQPDPQRAVVGTLRVAVDGYASGGMFSASAGAEFGLDLDGDTVRDMLLGVGSSYDAAGEMRWVRDIPIVLQPAAPRAVGLSVKAAAQATGLGASVTSHVAVTFTSGIAAPAVEFGRACGATISGWYQRELHTGLHGMRYTIRTTSVALRAGPPLAPALLVLGVDRVQLSIPGSGCDLLTRPVASVALSTDAQGGVDVQFRVPEGPIGPAAFQFVTLGSAGGIATTQGLSLSLW